MLYEQLSKERKEQQALDALPEWFTTLGWQMFKDKYLYNALSYRGRLIRIAETAAYYMPKRDVWKQRFFDIMWNGWLAPSTPVLANMGTDRGMPVSCLTGDSWINTKLGGMKQIKDIKLGDEVLTHKGRYMPVINKTSRPSADDLYLLKVRTRQTPIKITGNHQVLTNLGWVRVDELDERKHWIATNRELDVLEKDTVELPLNIYQEEPSTNPGHYTAKILPHEVEVTEELAWALGLWFAEGSLNRNKNTKKIKPYSSHGRSIKITMHHNEEPYLLKWGEIMNKYFGVEFNIHKAKQGLWSNCTINSIVLATFFGQEFGVNCKTKYLPRYLMNMSSKNCRSFLEGFYCGDGRKSSGSKITTPDIRIANPYLCGQLYEMCLRCGLDVSLSLQDKGSSGRSYQLSFFDGGLHPRERKRAYTFIDFADGNRYCRFSLEKLSINEEVFDIEVKEDHSFSVAGVVVHNCSGGYVPDSIDGFYTAQHETALLTQQAFGTSAYLGDIRPRGSSISGGGKASGILPVFKDFVQLSQDVSQGGIRRGAWAGYVSIEHDDFWEIVSYILNEPDDCNVGWNIHDSFIEKLEAEEPEAIKRLQEAMYVKCVTGRGYFFFVDKVNRSRPVRYEELELLIKASNLCTEITLPSDEDHTFTCVLSSMNLAKYDEWKDTDAVFWATVFLDCVAEDFINRGSKIKGLEKAVRFTYKSRALGLGTLGFHTYLQQNNIAIESLEAHFKNMEIYKHLHDESLRASQWMAQELGEPEWCKGHGVRNSHRCAIAPNTSSALICGSVSQGIEPVYQNVYTQGSASGDMYRINPVLLKIMKEKGVYNKKVLEDIASKQGSVQHVDWLDDHQKLVFKTAFEIDQKTLIRLASARQQYICQAQSLNLFFNADEDEQYIMEVHKEAFLDPNIKSLYYLRSLAGVQTSKECLSCEG